MELVIPNRPLYCCYYCFGLYLNAYHFDVNDKIRLSSKVTFHIAWCTRNRHLLQIIFNVEIAINNVQKTWTVSQHVITKQTNICRILYTIAVKNVMAENESSQRCRNVETVFGRVSKMWSQSSSRNNYKLDPSLGASRSFLAFGRGCPTKTTQQFYFK